MKYRSVYFLLILFFMSCGSSDLLYRNNRFKIDKDRVKQGEFEAKVISDTEMTTTFISPYKMPTHKVLDFKFALNGMDNERYPGEDHHLVMEPVNGKQVSPVYTFAQADPKDALYDELLRNDYLVEDVDLTLRCDMRQVLSDFKEQGYFVLFNGEKFYENDFKGVYIAGSTLPLDWTFSELMDKPEREMKDPDGDGIYEVTVSFSTHQTADASTFKNKWSLESDLSAYPQLTSEIPLLDALYNRSLEEMIQDIREDQAFMAGAKWPGVWTRDISYAIILSLANLEPEIAKNSLMHKVDNNRIIQDTGTGGSWPVSSDRMVWAVAAWEIYLTNGDTEWLCQAYEIIKNSAKADKSIVFDETYGLFRGESSFLDWREQSYPRWMDPKDIYMSMNLGTNVVHFKTWDILAKMADILGEPSEEYKTMATRIKTAMNRHFWQEDKGWYGQYLYGRNHMSLSAKPEALGEALCILFGIADENQSQRILENMPVLDFGPSCFYPQIPNIPPYHNNGIWPFVVAYWTLAAKETGNMAAMENGLASIYRVAALYLSNYENIVAETGDFMGTEINSERQLWSVGGNLATFYKMLFGMRFGTEGLVFDPVIPEPYKGHYKLENFKYRDARLTIEIDGFGDQVKEFKLDGEVLAESEIPVSVKGDHIIEIQMSSAVSRPGSINRVKNKVAPETPVVKYSDGKLSWEAVEEDQSYEIWRNGKFLTKTDQLEFTIEKDEKPAEYQVLTAGGDELKSFLSEPIEVINKELIYEYPIKQVVRSGIRRDEKFYYPLSKKDALYVNVPVDGNYNLVVQYSNGAGPINTSNKCCIRKLYVNSENAGPVVLPQRGAENWSETGDSHVIPIGLKKGVNRLLFIYDQDCENMNKLDNTAWLRGIRLTCLD